MSRWLLFVALSWLLCCCLAGCRSPYAQDRLAAAGAGVGGVTGALVGAASGHTAEGALIGAAVGATAGAITGDAIDEAEARNRAAIEAHMRRPVPQGAVSVDDVIAMVHAGVPEQIVVSHVQTRGMAQPVDTPDLIRMQQYGVPPAVMAATERPPVARSTASTVIVEQPRPNTVIVEPHGYYDADYHYYGYPYYRPSVGFGGSCHCW